MDSGRKARRALEEYEIDALVDDSYDRRKKRHCDSGSEIVRYCGRESCVRIFGVVFPRHSYPIDAFSFKQLDSCRWCLDMAIFVGTSYEQVTEMCIFLFNQFVLPPEKALAVYVQSPGSAFQYCGGISNVCPSAMITLLWPKHGGKKQLTALDAPPLNASIGVSLEDLSTLPALNIRQYYHVEKVALKIGENFFHFMQSCSKAAQDGRIIVPLNLLDQWFVRFKDKASKDPDYLKQFQV
ncbi:hypothetical protein SELMODRAFT_91593 [Selaginella moellendorffii]|uniref:Uncharacterized protein n=1 Tax=Selaginella moellendorffii TaxID=88036 RepID=D8RDR4_SELML|nr:uncharacterized protein LOC9660098 isoform X1 [Selaginella moellendorffii]XP_024530307.1 uncharacterized protein LOC9660098 isoform X1 [Selaginella moellendorffii]EFJ29547.1 hypothetical protein SELMODRAFT_91593 [Selaginella moellendorffii]|eukprot:XP_002969459.1 uncharacterized protein LOC9660098 isoform X1 [Selaginella moellendorffii]